MDPYYSPSTYYHQTSCPLHDSYADPYASYPPQPTPTHYYPSYIDQTSPPMVFYNSSTTNNYAQPNTATGIVPTTPELNRTFEFAPPVNRRRRRQRTVFSKDQVDILDQIFEKNPYPDIQLREQLSEQLDVPEARIQVWFKNRRSRVRTNNKNKN